MNCTCNNSTDPFRLSIDTTLLDNPSVDDCTQRFAPFLQHSNFRNQGDAKFARLFRVLEFH